MGRVSQVLRKDTRNRPVDVKFREIRTHVRPPELLDQVAASQIQVGKKSLMKSHVINRLTKINKVIFWIKFG